MPINPSRDEVQGLKAYPSLAALDRPVDLAIIGTAAAAVEGVIVEGIAAGVRSFVVLSSGFSNTMPRVHGCRRGSPPWPARTISPWSARTVSASSMPKLLIASFTTAMEDNDLRCGGFGFVSQSGALGAYFLDLVLQAGLGVSRWITTGNECDVDIAGSLGMLVDDPKTQVIGAYIEDIKDGPAFRNALRDAARGRQAGVPDQGWPFLAGAAAAASHTGAIAGEDRVYQACFDQYGAIRVASVTEMIDAAKLVLHNAVPSAGRIGVLSVSGGAGVLLADAIEAAGLGFPKFSAETVTALAATLPGFSKPQSGRSDGKCAVEHRHVPKHAIDRQCCAGTRCLHPFHRVDALDLGNAD